MPDPRSQASVSRAARILPLLVFVSGAAALVYESLWMRSFGLVFGSTTGAVALVLAVFMAGLALGSAAAARRAARDPLGSYGLVELGAGGCALLTLPLLRALPAAYAALAVGAGLASSAEAAGRMLLAALVLLPATVLLGASVPLALAFLERAGVDTRAGFGRLYLLNTLGGATGVLVATYVLLPSLGVRATLVAAAACSLFAGGLARRWAREIGPLPARARAAAGRAAAATADRAAALVTAGERTAASSPADIALALALAAASGASTFGAEVLWTRSLALVVGSSVYAFNLMLLAVLLGIAGGAAAYGRWRTRIARPALAVGRLFLAAGLAVLAGQWLIGRLPEAYLVALRVVPVSFFWHQAATLGLCLAALLPVTLLLGVTFPLLLHLFDPEPGAAQRDAGMLYAVNTAGAIAGALAAYLWLVPRLGLQPPYLLFAALLLAGAAWALARARGLKTAVGAAARRGRPRRRVARRAALEAVGPGGDVGRCPPLRPRVARDGPRLRPRVVAAPAAIAALLPRGRRGGRGRLGTERNGAALPVRERQDRRGQRRRGRRDAEADRPRADASPPAAAPRAGRRLGRRRDRGVDGPPPRSTRSSAWRSSARPGRRRRSSPRSAAR